MLVCTYTYIYIPIYSSGSSYMCRDRPAVDRARYDSRVQQARKSVSTPCNRVPLARVKMRTVTRGRWWRKKKTSSNNTPPTAPTSRLEYYYIIYYALFSRGAQPSSVADFQYPVYNVIIVGRYIIRVAVHCHVDAGDDDEGLSNWLYGTVWW